MIEIVNGSLESTQKDLKKLLATMQSRLTKFRQSVKKNDRTVEQNETIAKYEEFIKRFGVSKMLPVRVGHIVINYKLYQQLTNKLKGFEISEELKENMVVVTYAKKGVSGQLELYDIKKHFDGLDFFATGEIVT